MSEAIMKKRQAAIDEAYEAQWDAGRGSHHPDYDPQAAGPDAAKATRETEELLNAIIKARATRGRAVGQEGWARAVGGRAQRDRPGAGDAHVPCFACLLTRRTHATLAARRGRRAERHPAGVQEDRGGR
jgi:hypothetical protein